MPKKEKKNENGKNQAAKKCVESVLRKVVKSIPMRTLCIIQCQFFQKYKSNNSNNNNNWYI